MISVFHYLAIDQSLEEMEATNGKPRSSLDSSEQNKTQPILSKRSVGEREKRRREQQAHLARKMGIR